jgi:tetratricopeptide (TPR) repeat protein
LVAKARRRQARATRATGALRVAERLYRAGHDLARDAADFEGAAEGAIGVGNVLEDQGRWHEAREWYLAALQLLPPTGGPRPEQWHALLNLHVAMRSLGEVEESEEWLRLAEDVAEILKDPAAPAVLANARGQLHMARGEFAAARARYDKALAAPAGAWARVNFRLNLAEALLADGRDLEAAEAAREAERDALVYGVASKLPEVYRLLGSIAAARGNEDAFVLFERALQVTRERGLPILEDALTNQAYAESLGAQDPERASAMRARAAALYQELGIPGTHRPWADSHGLARELQSDGTTSPHAGPQAEEGDHER